jgi:hypothetical protein
MRSDITRRFPKFGKTAAPEGPGPPVLFKTESLQFQEPIGNRAVTLAPLPVPEPDGLAVARAQGRALG